jgi:hypothetical protein
MTEFKDSTDSFGICRNLLDKLSNKEAQVTLKALCAIYNLRAVSSFVPIGTQEATATRVSRVNRNPKAKVINQLPKVREIKDKIKDLNRKISEKSFLNGSKLPMEDELLIQRTQLFRDLKGAQNKSFLANQNGNGTDEATSKEAATSG